MDDRLAAGGGRRMIVAVRMGDSGRIPGSSILDGELIIELDGALRRRGKWLFSSDAICGGKIRFPSNLTRGESIGVKDNCDDKWDGDIGATSSSKSKNQERV